MVSTTFGLKLFFIYGSISNLTLFLLYILSKLVASICGVRLFSLQYCSTSSLFINNIGLIYFPSLSTGIPPKPSSPVPLIILIKIVSAWSFALCAVAILLKLILFIISLKKLYLASLPASSDDFPVSKAYLFISILLEKNLTPNSSHNLFEYSSSLFASSPLNI